MAFVLDASTCLAWCFPDEANACADAVLHALRHTEALVPAVWPLEIANVVLVGERCRRLTPTQTVDFFHALRSLPIRIHDLDLARALGPVLTLAREQNLSAYDTSYLDLAMQEGVPLATQDARLRAAAERVGVEVMAL